jgi:flagellar biosynthesis protein FliQ
MNEADVLEVAHSAIWATIMMSAPLVGPAMLLGIAIAFGQALTQIQENTLTFVPKMLVVFLGLMMASSFIGGQLQILTETLYQKIEFGFADLS